MAVVYIATSKNLAGWAADVGLTKHVYKLGVAEGSADDANRNGGSFRTLLGRYWQLEFGQLVVSVVQAINRPATG